MCQTPQQVTVVAELMAGKTVTEAAKSANVSRETVHRWLREEWDFQAAFNQAKSEVIDAVTMRLTALVGDAVATVAKTLEKGDVRTALEILKGLVMLRGERIQVGSIAREFVRTNAETQVAETRADLHRREYMATLGPPQRQE